MLKIVNQTTKPLGYRVARYVPPSDQLVAQGVLEPNRIVAYRIDNDPQNNSSALNCSVSTWKGEPGKPGAVLLEGFSVPGNATVVFSTQIITGLLQPGSRKEVGPDPGLEVQ